MSAAAASRRSYGWMLALLGVGIALGAMTGQGLVQRATAPSRFPVVSGELEIGAVSEPVDVDRDGRGIPHIEAKSERERPCVPPWTMPTSTASATKCQFATMK